jgi:nicotinamide-nucleotide amidase
MLAEVISIGDELTSGQRLDTNSQWLSTRLGELGVEVRFHTTVADELAANVLVFRAAIERADIVVASGGLGPTADDLTREALAAATGRALGLDAGALEYIVALFARRRRPMPESNRLQAMFPAGSRVVPNPTGSAPGIDLDAPRAGKKPCRVFALPGVPAEMRRMWDETVAPAIAAMSDSPRVIRHRRIKCFGMGESDLEEMLPDLIRRGREPQVGITVSGATITLRITAAGATAADCYAAMEPTIATIHKCLGNLVYGEEDDELQDAVVRLLTERKERLATVEWGTGGILANWLSEAAARMTMGADCYAGGYVVSSTEARRALLWADDVVSAATTARKDEKATANLEALAMACRLRLRADYALATGPLPEQKPGEPVPDFHYALDRVAGVQKRSSPYAGPPEILKFRAAKQVLNLLRLELLRAK